MEDPFKKTKLRKKKDFWKIQKLIRADNKKLSSLHNFCQLG